MARRHQPGPWARILGIALVWCSLASLAFGATINGQAYVSLDEVARRCGMEHRWVTPGKTVEVRSEWSGLRFTLHQRHFELNGRKIYLGVPIALNQGKLMISEIDYERTLKPLLFPRQFDPKPKLYRIVLDAGHGGKDTGARNDGIGLQEKNLALDLAKRVQRKLAAYGYDVVLTREDDRFIPLEKRPAIANRVKADLFVSLHFNAVDSSKVEGIETFVITPPGHPSTSASKLTASAKKTYPGNASEPWSLLAGYHIQRELLTQTGGEDRGLKRARFAVLRDLNCPGVLVEGGFVSHPREGRDVGSAAYREKLANAIAQGILNYQRALNRARGIGS